MANFLTVEEEEKSLPLLCIFGTSKILREELVRQNSSKFRIILVSNKKPDFLNSYKNVYFVSYEKAALLPKMDEQIFAATVFLSKRNTLAASFLFEKVKKDSAKCLVLCKVSNFQSLSKEILNAAKIPTLKIALYEEILSRKKGELKGYLSKNIDNVILNHTIKVNGEEIVPVYGITLSDAILGIQRLLFGNFKNGVVYYLFYKTPENILEAARLIARIEPEATIIFTDEKTHVSLPMRNELTRYVTDELRLEDSYIDTSLEGFEKGVERLFAEKVEVKNVEKKAKKRRVFKALRFETPVKFALLSLFFGGLLFVFVNLLFLGLGLFFLKIALTSLENNDFQKAGSSAKVSYFFLNSIKPTIETAINTIGFLDTNSSLQMQYSLVLRGRELIEIASDTVGTIVGNEELNEKSLTNSLAKLTYLYQEGQRIALEINNPKLSEQLQGTYAKLLSFSEVLPEVMGFSEEKNYLLLFQNDEELRPTGGFIGSIGELTVKNGKITNITIQDVYELDGQLKNHIEPPFVVRRYLQPHLYLRDSNFYLDFQEVASTSAKIYNLETGKKPDAVIALDLRVLKEVIGIAGPISLPAYDVTVTKDTVSQFIQNTIKDNFFPGSTQKKDILNSVFAQIVEKSRTDPKFNVAVLKLLPQLLEQKSIQVAFSNNSIQKIFSANNYAGELKDTRKNNDKQINDFLYINEANIGVNKVNAAVSRKVLYNVLLGQDKIVSKAMLELVNNSPTENYTSYITLVAPSGSVLKSIKINGVEQSIIQAIVDPQVYEAPDFVAPVGLETEQYEKGGWAHFAFIAVAKNSQKTTIEVEYENGSAKPLQTIVNYSLYYVKQPGTSPYDLKLTLDYPENYIPIKTKADTFGKNFMEITSLIDKDLIQNVTLQVK